MGFFAQIANKTLLFPACTVNTTYAIRIIVQITSSFKKL
jgi:hypothetical protein